MCRLCLFLGWEAFFTVTHNSMISSGQCKVFYMKLLLKSIQMPQLVQNVTTWIVNESYYLQCIMALAWIANWPPTIFQVQLKIVTFKDFHSL